VTTVAISYLSHGQERRFWQTFLDRLESSRATKRNPDLTVAGAAAAFQMFLANDEIQCVR
jgi:heme oxygenase